MLKKIILLIALSLLSSSLFASTIYVKHVYGVPDAIQQDGLSWDTAFATINSALNIAQSNDQIWVVNSAFFVGNDKLKSFEITKPNISIYGGFLGTETNLSDRNMNNKTTLSGDYNLDTILDTTNTRNLLKITGNSALVDGFLFTMARGWDGAGIQNDSYNTTVQNCIFINNYDESGHGAAICNLTHTSNNFNVVNCAIINNSGRVSAVGNYGYMTMVNCTVAGNISSNGYSIYSSFSYQSEPSTIVFKNCILNDAGGMGGGVVEKSDYLQDKESRCYFINCCINAVVWAGYASPLNSTYSNPKFVNSSTGDFRLFIDSPCVDTGTTNGAPATDMIGVVRPVGAGIDMGCYE